MKFYEDESDEKKEMAQKFIIKRNMNIYTYFLTLDAYDA